MRTVLRRSGIVLLQREELLGNSAALILCLPCRCPWDPHPRGGKSDACVVRAPPERGSTILPRSQKWAPPLGCFPVERSKRRKSLQGTNQIRTDGMTWMRKIWSHPNHGSDQRESPGHSWTELQITRHSNYSNFSFLRLWSTPWSSTPMLMGKRNNKPSRSTGTPSQERICTPSSPSCSTWGWYH